jgi:hypothetical protein
MSSKYVVVTPIPGKDALTVSTAIVALFTQCGVCDTMMSDQGSESIASCTREVFRLFQVPQQFTPSFVHRVGA